MDSSRNGFPPSFFDHLSPGLKSLAVYSCHGDHVKSFYHLSQALHSDASLPRALFTAKESTFLDQEGVAPLSAFRAFLYRVDRSLAKKSFPRSATAPATEKMCSIQVTGFTSTQNDFAVMINGDYVGIVHEGQSGFQKSFPCSYLDGRDPTVFVENLSIFDASDATVQDPSITLTTESAITQLKVKPPFRRENGSVSAIKGTL